MTTTRFLVIFYIYLFLAMAIILVVGIQAEYPVRELFDDPGKGHRLLGVFTYAGVLFWSFTAAICLFCSTLMWSTGNARVSSFTALAGVLSLILLFDDLFLLHEWMQTHFKLIGENGVFAVYGVLFAIFVVYFRRIILASDFILLGVAAGFFATSLLIDVVIEPWLWRLGGWSLAIEDLPKLFGIFTWFAYFFRFCYQVCILGHGRSR